MADTTNTTTVHTAEVVRYDDPVVITERVAVAAFIAGYTEPTRRSYATDLRIFAGWCHDHGVYLLNVKRPHLETFARWMEQNGRMPSTIARRLSTLSSFYKYCQLEDILNRNPATNIRRPKVHDESRTLGLDRDELGALLVQAGLGDLRDGALITLLALNGLRISEALNANIEDFSTERGHRTLAIVRKGAKHVTIPIAPRTGRALDLYIGDRTIGPIFRGVEGGRMDRYCADRMVKRLVKRTAFATRSSPPPSMPVSHCATPKKQRATPILARRCATTAPDAALTDTPRTSSRRSSPEQPDPPEV
jgi:integrase/recombinase XerD